MFPDVLCLSHGLSVAALKLLCPSLGLFDPLFKIRHLFLESDPAKVPVLRLQTDLPELCLEGLVLLGLAIQCLLEGIELLSQVAEFGVQCQSLEEPVTLRLLEGAVLIFERLQGFLELRERVWVCLGGQARTLLWEVPGEGLSHLGVGVHLGSLCCGFYFFSWDSGMV